MGVAVAGTIGWTVALVVLLVVGPPAGAGWWPWVCVAGIVIGLFAIWYVPRLQRGRAAAAERMARAKDLAEPHADALDQTGAPNQTDDAPDQTGEGKPVS